MNLKPWLIGYLVIKESVFGFPWGRWALKERSLPWLAFGFGRTFQREAFRSEEVKRYKLFENEVLDFQRVIW